jgi:hypothetical protein
MPARMRESQAAAGAAEGALGLVRPAASGLSSRWNTAPRDFSLRALARPLSGRAVTAAPILAPWARNATARPARTMAAHASMPVGVSSECASST